MIGTRSAQNNAHLAAVRARRREDLLVATEKELAKVRAAVAAGRLVSAAAIGLRLGRVAGRYKMAKHFSLTIGEGTFSCARKEAQIAAEAALDGIYVLRTDVLEEQLCANAVVAAYKGLSRVEDAFLSLKSVDLLVRPIYHRLQERVRAHAFLCVLAEHLVFHLHAAWAPLTFADEEKDAPREDAVADAPRGGAAEMKARAQKTAEGELCHSFHTLLTHLATLVRNAIRLPAQGDATFEQVTRSTPLRREAFALLGVTVPLHFKLTATPPALLRLFPAQGLDRCRAAAEISDYRAVRGQFRLHRYQADRWQHLARGQHPGPGLHVLGSGRRQRA